MLQSCRWKKIYESRFKRKFTRSLRVFPPALPCYLHIRVCVEVNEHRYACISIKGKYDERKTGHVAAVFRTCRAHNASDRFLSMWRKKRRLKNYQSPHLFAIHVHSSLCISMTLRIIARVLQL